MPKAKRSKKFQENKLNGIRTSRYLKRLTISFLGSAGIDSTIEFGEILKESDDQKEYDLAKLILQYSYKETNYGTTINLKQVTYNKSNDKLFAKEGTVEYLITRHNNEIKKKCYKMENLTVEFTKNLKD
ncbi:26051_t:CDS:1 [Gigaspora margarita]|uniref:26051_t:CDS:1 n=1 Tax=Gigaspora margarita TaxID=4874 RepID=A0ABN7ULF4_GIGMA|nr:26051_t:CDS:1 [Gigaspora margarita]